MEEHSPVLPISLFCSCAMMRIKITHHINVYACDMVSVLTYCVSFSCLSLTPKGLLAKMGKEDSLFKVTWEDVEAVVLSIYT